MGVGVFLFIGVYFGRRFRIGDYCFLFNFGGGRVNSRLSLGFKIG